MTAREIKKRFPLADEIRARGIEITRGDFCRCPFHEGDNSPSMKIYAEQNAWHCYGCGLGGDVIDFVMKIDGLNFQEACKKISGESSRREGGFEAQRIRLYRKAKEGRKRKLTREINKELDTARECWQKLRNMKPEDEGYAEILMKWQYANYAADCMMEEIK